MVALIEVFGSVHLISPTIFILKVKGLFSPLIPVSVGLVLGINFRLCIVCGGDLLVQDLLLITTK